MKLPANYAEFSDKAQRRNRWQTLTQLVHHPLVSAAQLATLRRIPLKTLNWHLKRLIADGWVYRVSYRPPVRTPHPTFLYALTPKALEFLCPPEFASWSAYAHARDCQLPRLERLLSMERVVCVRDCLLAPFWRKSEWSIRRWDEEVQLPYREYDRPFHPEQHAPQTVSLHGAALLRGRARTPRQGQWTWLAIEVDWGGLPVRLHRERWEHFLRAQGDERFLGRAQQGHFPPLLVIADTHARLVEYGNALIDSATKRRGGRDLIPWVYLTQASSLAHLHKDAQAPVWYSLRHGEWVAFLEDFQGALDEPQVYWVRLPAPTARPSPRVWLPTHEQAAVLAGSNAKGLSRNGVRAFAYLTLVLRSTDKRILNELGHHPLLTDRELAFQLHASLHDVRGALARLQEHGLVTRHTPPPQRTPWPRRRPDVRAAYTLADRGVRFHSAVDGFGREVNRYVHARGWGWHGREDGWSRRLPKPATAARSHTDWGLVFASAVLHWDTLRGPRMKSCSSSPGPPGSTATPSYGWPNKRGVSNMMPPLP